MKFSTENIYKREENHDLQLLSKILVTFTNVNKENNQMLSILKYPP